MTLEATDHGIAAKEKSELVCGGIASIDVGKVERHIAREVETYSAGGFPRQSERYYYLMSALHVTRMMFHDGNCQPFHREFYRRLAQIHHSQQGAKPESALPPSTDAAQQGVDQPQAQ
ncbi:hypothetical protein IW146_009926 [Coemansia sp. RSA 922]|nr:hypothetical protein H4S03_007981 [Coemansia sp. S3946]KAJ2038955.1 hypothetical protein H4S04_008234 [Coemansia sp. S16]KAJ2044910.1 hypothetical protein GGI08_006968 [Coemansia sp. S2]KAJ2098707.1 hypothetical protein IW146_009926 [Coemansia sp. RSA 922]